MNKKHVWGIVVVLVIIGAFVMNARKPQDLSAEPIKIGSISALTGVGAAIGEAERRGAQLAIDEINANGGVLGRPLQLISEDVSIDKIKNGATVTQKLINIDKVIAIVGPQWDEPAEPILPLIEAAKIPMVGPDTSDQLEKDTNYDYFFSTWYDNRVGIRELLRHAQKENIENFTVIRLVDAGFWKFTADTFVNEAPNYGVNIVDDINLGNPLVQDFRTVITKVKSQKPEAVFVVTSDYNQCTLLKQMDDLALNVLSFGTESSGDSVSLVNCPQSLERRVFSTPVKTKGQIEFEEKFEKKYGSKPEYPSIVTAYDAVRMIADALRRSKLEGGEALQKAIAETNMPGAAVPVIKFNEKGFLQTPEDAFEMKTMKGGVFVEI